MFLERRADWNWHDLFNNSAQTWILQRSLCSSREQSLSFCHLNLQTHPNSSWQSKGTNKNKQRCCLFRSGGLFGRLVNEVLLMPRNYSGAEVVTVHALLFMLLLHRCCSNKKKCCLENRAGSLLMTSVANNYAMRSWFWGILHWLP